MKATEIAIIGAGPAGACAALWLARGGREVVLIEREPAASHKMCGEFISGEAVSYLRELGVDLEQLGAVELGQLAIFGARRGAVLELPFQALGLSRQVLDEALVREASRAGAEVRYQTRVTKVAPAPDGRQRVYTNASSLDAATVFLATGKHELAGLRRGPGQQDDLVAFKMHYTLSETQRRALRGRVELGLFAGGYVGLQEIEGGRANLCFVVKRDRLRALGTSWAVLADRLCAELPHLALRLGGAQPLWDRPLALANIPYGFQQRHARAGVWCLGDQAAVIPSFAGDGIAIALHSARLAAHLFMAGHGADEFQRLLSRQLQRQIRLASLASRIMVRPAVQRMLVECAGVVPGIVRWLALETRVVPWALSARAAG